MRRFMPMLSGWLLCFAIAIASPLSASAAEARVLKVLPQFLDSDGKQALTPSLYDRDAYQAFLHKHPEKRSALRFAIQWKGASSPAHPLKFKLEVRGVAQSQVPKPFEKIVSEKHGSWFSHWDNLIIPEEDYRKIQEVTAWRITIWDGDKQVSEQQSFLW